jgi:hypothetical protein
VEDSCKDGYSGTNSRLQDGQVKLGLAIHYIVETMYEYQFNTNVL